jgi:7,8-dihydropterin-6-yl-methyl-4-(beta-D-ribofuranosyl)aminobenzene 5'-phosphate synthase
MPDNKITIIYDNRALKQGIRPGWGFSAFIEYNGITLLFDTGGDKIVLEANAAALGIDLKSPDFLFFSHEHCDHVGAASSVLRSGLKVVYPISFPRWLKDKISAAKAESIEVSGPEEFSPGLISTGELGTPMKEQSLILITEKGLVVVTGCAHPGIVNIARVATDLAGEPLLLLLGGFHLGAKSAEQVRRIADQLHELKVKQLGPCHCTGDLAINVLQEAFGKRGLEVMAGSLINI